MYPRLGAKEAGNSETPVNVAKQKNLLSGQRSKNWATSKTKLLDNNCSAPVKHRKGYVSTLPKPTKAELGSLDSHYPQPILAVAPASS